MKKQLLFTTFLLCALALTLTVFTALVPIQVYGASTDAKILSYSWYQTPTNDLAAYIGDLIVVGELQNVGTANIYYVYVIGSAYINDVEVARYSCQVLGNNLLPGEKAPFYLDFVPESILIDNLKNWADVTNVKVTVGYLANTDKSMYQGLTVASEGGYSSDIYTVIGKVQNVGTESVDNVRVITTFYNAAGTVVSLNYTDVFQDPIKPGSSKTFTATPVDYYSGNDIESYTILIQSTIHSNDPTPTNPSNTKAPSPSATKPASTTTDSELTIATRIVIAAIILSVVSAITVLILRNHKKHA